MAKRFRPLGLRWGRLRAWLRVLREEQVTNRQLVEMVRLAWPAFWKRSPRRPHREIVRDYRVCVRCPYHNPDTRSCLLCGCFMPYKIAAGGACAAREADPDSKIGFGSGIHG